MVTFAVKQIEWSAVSFGHELKLHNIYILHCNTAITQKYFWYSDDIKGVKNVFISDFTDAVLYSLHYDSFTKIKLKQFQHTTLFAVFECIVL